MLRIKKGLSEQLLQMALLLSLMGCDRLWPPFGIWSTAPSAEIEVGPWNDDSYSYGFGPLTQIHPKSVDRYLDRHWLLNELLSLGRYDDRYPSNIEAYLLNVDGEENGQDDQQQEQGGQVVKTEPKENDSEDEDVDKVFDTDIVEDVLSFTPEDAALVESIWKGDLDCGSPTTAGESRGVSFSSGINEGLFLSPGDEPPSRNQTLSCLPSSSNRRWYLPPLNNNSNDLSVGSSSFPSRYEPAQNSDGNSWEVSHLLVDLRAGQSCSRRSTFNDNDTKTSDLDAEDYKNHNSTSGNVASRSLTSDSRVKETLYEPSFHIDFDELEFLEEMMQCYSQPPPSSRHFQGRMGYTRTAGNGMDQRGWQDLAACSPMLAFPSEGQHHQHHYGQHPSSALNYPSSPAGMYHHHHHQNNAGNVLLQNVSLCAPPPPPPPSTSIDMGGSHVATSSSSSSLSHYHHHHSSPIGVSTNCNLSSAVATSLHLAGSSSEQPTAFKTEPHQHEMMFPYQNHNNEMAPSSDGLLTSILNDEDLQLMDPAMGAEGAMYPVRMMDSASSSVGCNNNNNNNHNNNNNNSNNNVMSGGGTTMVQNSNAGGDSDSAVSSMGSERVPSLSSDTEWMETNSDSGHNDGYPSHSHQEYGKMRWLDNYLYSGSRSHSAAPQKKYQLYGRRLTDPVPGAPNATEAARSNHVSLVPDTLNLPYDMSVREGIPVPGSSEFSRHMASCSRVMTPEHQVALNHTYALPPEGPRTPRNKLKSSKRSEDEQLTRDEKRARNLNIPISVDDIINLPMDEFNERLSKYDLSESQLTLIRDIRRRGKNKVAAQNCRKRKLDQILSLADEVKQMKDRKFNLLQEREYLMTERMRVKTKYDLLYNHIFASLRDPDGNPYSPYTHTLREQPDGSVSIVPRNNGTQPDRNPRSKQHKDK